MGFQILVRNIFGKRFNVFISNYFQFKTLCPITIRLYKWTNHSVKGSDRHCMVVELGLQYLFSGFGESRDFKGV